MGSPQVCTIESHLRVPPWGTTLGSQLSVLPQVPLRVLPQRSTLKSHTRVSNQGPTLGSHLSVPPQGSILGFEPSVLDHTFTVQPIKVKMNLFEITLPHRGFPVNLLHIFRELFLENASIGLLLCTGGCCKPNNFLRTLASKTSMIQSLSFPCKFNVLIRASFPKKCTRITLTIS